MADPGTDLPTELRFNTPGWKYYGKDAAWLALLGGFSVFVWAAEAVAQWGGPQYRVGIFYQLRGLYIGLITTAITVFASVLIVGTVIRTWRRWRQLRPPAVIIDTAGVRFAARRRPIAIPWHDVEELELRRDKLRTRIISYVWLRLTPNASVLNGSPRDKDRNYNVGGFDRISVPDQIAMEILRRIAGPRLEIEEHDRYSR